ncbi:MAG: cation:proton antiporter [candidate division NC10 bacterium]|nr:cation:proton antiporter [candidate division NC10 bacterium]
MTPEAIFFRDFAYVIVAAVLGGALAWASRQPLILGYVLGGIFISPLTPGPAISDLHTFELFAEIGVVLLMFSIGIEFSLHDLLREKWVALLGGPLGILLSVGLSVGVGTLLGWRPLQGVIVGMVISVASTMVLSRLLLDRGELHAAHGRVMIGITLVEDLAVVVLIVLIPALGALEPGRLVAIGLALAKAAAILVPFWFLAARIFPPLMTRVARTRNQELFLLVALGVGLGTAALAQAVGLSLALGAFLGGLIISESDYAHETLARLLSLRDAFVAMFFVTLGALIQPSALFANLPILGAMVGLIIVGKILVWGVVVRLFGYPLQTALRVAVGLSQIGEFSFILVQVARSAGHVGTEVYNATLAASLLTILVNALLVRVAYHRIGRAVVARQQRPLSSAAGEWDGLRNHVVLCGFGRVGSAVGEALETFAIRYIVIETDPDIVKVLRARGVPCLYGDAAHRKILEGAGADRAALVVLTIPEGERARSAIRHLRAMKPQVPILARTHERRGHEGLREAGATEVVQPELEAAATLIRHALGRLLLPQDRVLAYLHRFHEGMEAAPGRGTGETDALPQIREVTLGAGPLADQSLREARVRERFGVTIVAITRADGDVLLNPSADTILRPGDRIRLFGRLAQIEAFKAEAER